MHRRIAGVGLLPGHARMHRPRPSWVHWGHRVPVSWVLRVPPSPGRMLWIEQSPTPKLWTCLVTREWLGQLGEVGGKLTELVYHPHEPPELWNRHWWVHLSYGRCLFGVCPDSLWVDYVAQESELFLFKLALLRVECHTCVFDALKDCLESAVMLCFVFAEDQDVVHLALDSLQAGQEFAHAALKVLRGAGDAEWEFIEAIASHGCDECCK